MEHDTGASGPDEAARLAEAAGTPDEAAGTLDEAAGTLNDAAEPDEGSGADGADLAGGPGQVTGEPRAGGGPDEGSGADGADLAGGPGQVTGEPRVDAALGRLDQLAGLPAAEHPAVFEQVHASLRDVLGELDLDQGPQAGARQRQGG
jgi:hypothetical protein